MAQQLAPRDKSILESFIKENFMVKEFLDTKAESMLDNTKIIKGIAFTGPKIKYINGITNATEFQKHAPNPNRAI